MKHLPALCRRTLLAGASAWAAALLPVRAPRAEPLAEPAPHGAMLAALTDERQNAAAARLLEQMQGLDPRADDTLRLRVRGLSAALLQRPFAWNPVGEGSGHFDPDPPFTLDHFDCLTFIETVLALARARNLAEVFDDLALLRYGGHAPLFAQRLHFMSVDWLPALLTAGVADDAPQRGFCDAALGELDVHVDRRAWVGQLGANPMYRQAMLRASAAQRDEIAAWAAANAASGATLRYVTREALHRASRAHAEPAGDTTLLAAIVRPQTPFARRAGSDDPVTHTGWLLHVRGRWVLRAASLTAKRVVDLPWQSLLNGGGALPPALGAVLLRIRPRRTV